MRTTLKDNRMQSWISSCFEGNILISNPVDKGGLLPLLYKRMSICKIRIN